MRPYMSFGAGLEGGRLQVLWEDGERALCRGRRADEKRTPRNILAVRLTAEPPPPASVDRLVHEYGLKDHLESAWAVRPLELICQRDGTMLLLEHKADREARGRGRDATRHSNICNHGGCLEALDYGCTQPVEKSRCDLPGDAGNLGSGVPPPLL